MITCKVLNRMSAPQSVCVVDSTVMQSKHREEMPFRRMWEKGVKEKQKKGAELRG